MLPYLEMLGVTNTLAGFPNTNYISSEAILERVEQGQVTDLGSDVSLNLELLIGLNPDLVIAFDVGTNGAQLNQIEQAGIPVILCADYLESTAMGRAEWVKFFGALFDKRELADSLFNEVQREYDALRDMASDVADRPTVLTGIPYDGGAWFLPGGQNWAAKLFEDAGGQYYWADDPSANWLELSFESVFDKARGADFWIGTASYDSKPSMMEGDERYALFAPYENDKIYNYDQRLNSSGGNDYFESGYARPDRVLADLIYILHPELLPDHQLYYYRRLP